MTLATYVAKKAAVSLGGENAPLMLRGISLDDVTGLLGTHLPEIEKIFEMYNKPDVSEHAMAETLKTAVVIVKDAPNIVGQMIARCADEPDMSDVARTLPVDIQIECIEKILTLTFEEAGGAKKFGDKMLGLVAMIRPRRVGETD